MSKHEHPPTPTIQEQLVDIVFGEPQPEHIWRLGTKKAYYEARAKEPQIAALTLLITKARKQEANQTLDLHLNDGAVINWKGRTYHILTTESFDAECSNERVKELSGHKENHD